MSTLGDSFWFGDQVKTNQRSSRPFAKAWRSYCDAHGDGFYDPARPKASNGILGRLLEVRSWQVWRPGRCQWEVCTICWSRHHAEQCQCTVCLTGFHLELHLQTYNRTIGDKLHSKGAWLLRFIMVHVGWRKKLSIRYSMANQNIYMVDDCRDMLWKSMTRPASKASSHSTQALMRCRGALQDDFCTHSKNQIESNTGQKGLFYLTFRCRFKCK